MRRQVPIEDLKKLYTANDMVKAGCNGCAGCSDCCRGMGESVILDPLDVQRLRDGLGLSFAQLAAGPLELNLADGLILPNLKMDGPLENCGFLSPEGRCEIHSFRPGICRLFPLGRYYENGKFWYFLQNGECPADPKTKVKVAKWVDTPQLKRYEEFVLSWHTLLEDIGKLLENSGDEQLRKDLSMYLLNTFYVEDFAGEFYNCFQERLTKMRRLLAVLGKDRAEEVSDANGQR